MLIPASVDAMDGDDNYLVFLECALVTFLIGSLLYTSNYSKVNDIKLREAFLLTASLWFVLAAFAAIPIYLSERVEITYAAAYFEAVSGTTTSGGTALTGLDHLPRGLLLWRCMLAALGGVGIIVMAVAILPLLQIAGMQLFKRESSDTSDKVLPRAGQIAWITTITYVILAASCAFSYFAAGMSPFDAICHAFTTISTSGFSNYDANFAVFSGDIHVISTFFMFISGIPFVLYYQAYHLKSLRFFGEEQIRWYVNFHVLVIIFCAIWLTLTNHRDFLDSLRTSAFHIVSLSTSTGFTAEDYGLWGPAAEVLFVMLLLGFACTGSTGGGVKMFRFVVLYKCAVNQIKQLVQPHGVYVPTFDARPISQAVITAVLNFMILYFFSALILTLAVCLTGLDFQSGFTSVMAALSNTGPGLGPVIGPVGNYSTLQDSTLWILSFAMLLGRLELMTILVLFSYSFWKD
jgi:trk system potassium uptake protein TrkH